MKQFISTYKENVEGNNNIQKSINVPRKYIFFSESKNTVFSSYPRIKKIDK